MSDSIEVAFEWQTHDGRGLKLEEPILVFYIYDANWESPTIPVDWVESGATTMRAIREREIQKRKLGATGQAVRT